MIESHRRPKKQWSILFQESTILYRQLKILLEIFNQIHSRILVVFLVTTKIGMVFSAVVLLSSGNVAKSNSNILVNMILCQYLLYATIFIMITFGSCGNVHQSSCEILSTMRKKAEYFDKTGIEKRLVFRIIKSLPVLKIEFGITNFIEVTTPFMYLEFVLQRIVDCMLVYGK